MLWTSSSYLFQFHHQQQLLRITQKQSHHLPALLCVFCSCLLPLLGARPRNLCFSPNLAVIPDWPRKTRLKGDNTGVVPHCYCEDGTTPVCQSVHCGLFVQKVQVTGAKRNRHPEEEFPLVFRTPLSSSRHVLLVVWLLLLFTESSSVWPSISLSQKLKGVQQPPRAEDPAGEIINHATAKRRGGVLSWICHNICQKKHNWDFDIHGVAWR